MQNWWCEIGHEKKSCIQPKNIYPGQISIHQLPSTSSNIQNPTPTTHIQSPSSIQNPIVNILKKKQTNILEYTLRKLTINKQNKIDKVLLEMIIKDFQPFKMVEDKGFKNFDHMLNPSYKNPDPHKLSKVDKPTLY